jgi:DNA-binding CsgD family transcriptional regulator
MERERRGLQLKQGRDSDDDRAAIIAVIEEESAAWIRGDVEAWRACWVQDDHAQHINARPSVGARMLRGFDAIAAYMVPFIEGRADKASDAPPVKREDWRITIGKDMAWATFDQLVPMDAGPNAAPGRHNHLRILEKRGGGWKIAAIFHIPNRIGYYTTPWVRVDRNGVILETGAQADDALRKHASLQRIGSRLCARSAADTKKLRHALAEADDLIRSKTGRPPVALILQGEDPTSLSISWITIADMMTVVLLADDQLLTSTIQRAGEVYGLSPRQLRVAEAIARGMDLSSTAEMLGVRPNTVRTHVRRMFERLNVTSQPALIRALFSTAPPHT